MEQNTDCIEAIYETVKSSDFFKAPAVMGLVCAHYFGLHMCAR
ncbi:hypothetical protein F441_15975, partial [Phytophthora nicotianae CJ01A1]